MTVLKELGDRWKKPPSIPNQCKDFDDDCERIDDKFHCWKYAPECGICPYLGDDE